MARQKCRRQWRARSAESESAAKELASGARWRARRALASWLGLPWLYNILGGEPMIPKGLTEELENEVKRLKQAGEYFLQTYTRLCEHFGGGPQWKKEPSETIFH